jgi:hypothetical protein
MQRSGHKQSTLGREGRAIGAEGGQPTGRVLVVVGKIFLDGAAKLQEIHPLVHIQGLVGGLLQTKAVRTLKH